MRINNIVDRIKLPFRKEKELYSSIFAITGFYPHKINYYKQAFLHSSIAKRNAKGRPINNERLEFLGDAILGAIVGDVVYRHFDGKREGFLTTTRSKIVQRGTLNRLSNEIGIGRLILSSGHNPYHNSNMEGNAFEALIGAIYLDRGYSVCRRFIEKRILKQMINLDKVAYKEVNFKSKLLEWCQKNKVKLEFVEVEEKQDENHSPLFTYRVTVEGIEAGRATGYTKKESQQNVSKQTLQKLRRNSRFIDAVFAAKANRTKMEEEPVEAVPDVEAKNDFIISVRNDNLSKRAEKSDTKDKKARVKADATAETKEEPAENEPEDRGNDSAAFDFSDVDTALDRLSKEDIIAAAEAKAFAENA